MKKLIALFIALCLCLTLCLTLGACNNENVTGASTIGESKDRFKEIMYDGCSVIVDTETGVMYLWHKDGYGGGLTVMVDADGNPLIWEGYNE